MFAGAPIDIAAGRSALCASASPRPVLWRCFTIACEVGRSPRSFGRKMPGVHSATLGAAGNSSVAAEPADQIVSPAFAVLEATFRQSDTWTVDLPGLSISR